MTQENSSTPTKEEQIFQHWFNQAQKCWPKIQLDSESFYSYLKKRTPKDQTFNNYAGKLNINDLYLACACSRGDSIAIQEFERTYFPFIRSALKTLNLPQDKSDDFRQSFFEKLFVTGTNNIPKITQYMGEGDLRSWTCVAAFRHALNMIRKTEKTCSFESVAHKNIDLLSENQELGYMKQLYKNEFQQAFSKAIDSLSGQEQTILRYFLLDQLTLEQIGIIYDVEKSTISRWMAKIRKKILSVTRKELSSKLDVDRRQFNSIVALIQSQLDISIRGFLKDQNK